MKRWSGAYRRPMRMRGIEISAVLLRDQVSFQVEEIDLCHDEGPQSIRGCFHDRPSGIVEGGVQHQGNTRDRVEGTDQLMIFGIGVRVNGLDTCGAIHMCDRGYDLP